MTRPFLVTEWVVELVELELSIEITACTGFEDFWPFSRGQAESAADELRDQIRLWHSPRGSVGDLPTRQDGSLAKLSACTHSSAIVQKGDNESGSWV